MVDGSVTRWGSAPWVDDLECGKALEVADVAGHDGHAVHQRGRADQRITKGRRVGHVERGGAAGDRFVDGKHPVDERRGHAAVQPLAKDRSGRRITALGEQYAVLELVDGD